MSRFLKTASDDGHLGESVGYFYAIPSFSCRFRGIPLGQLSSYNLSNSLNTALLDGTETAATAAMTSTGTTSTGTIVHPFDFARIDLTYSGA